MATNPKDGRLLYHLTSLRNLEGIIMNGLQPRSRAQGFENVADMDIVDGREKLGLNDYTPFHFFPGSPFAGAVQKAHPTTDFVYLTISRSKAINFKVVPSHPLNYQGDLLSWDEGLSSISWEVMAQRNYNNHICKEVCMAEAVFKGSIQLQHFHCVYVKNEEVKKKVEYLFTKHSCIGIAFVNVNQYMFLSYD